MKCKECKKIISKQYKIKGGFCTEECKKAYMEVFKTKPKKVYKKSTKPKTTPISTEALKALCEPYGEIKWYNMAKKYCCNFDIRERDGTCITLAEPYFLFRLPCNECELGIALMYKYVKED